MNKEEYKRVVKIFNEAADLQGSARQEYLDRVCGDDKTLRSNVELFLAQDTDQGIEQELGIGRKLLARDLPLPEKIGCYAIKEKIAEGGMGAIYLAEQDHPRRDVALKMIRSGLFAQDTLKRFKIEAELLGMLQHPGIARIYEAGEAQTDSGNQPFFAMEYIHGLELKQYAAQHELDVAAKLELVARVCDAVGHAHQKGIVHRDLKPENILVVEAGSSTTGLGPARFARLGQPKVLDFGVARLTNSDVQVTTMCTDTGKLIGTLTYMSPEQVIGDSRTLDTRSDIYALGVILYELLAGHPPLKLQGKSIPEAIRIIHEKEPTRISVLNTGFRGDIDAILCKALEKDRDRRYPSVAILAEDLRRFLTDQPITARPPTLAYQLSRFIQRNKVFVASVLLAILSLTVGLVLALRSQREEARLRNLAERKTDEARLSAYAAQIQATMAYYIANNYKAARQQLLLIAPDQHGWERDFLSRSMEEDICFLPMEILTRPQWNSRLNGPMALFPVKGNCLRLFDFKSKTWSDVPFPTRNGRAAALIPDNRSALWGNEHGELFIIDLEGKRPLKPVLKIKGNISDFLIAPNGELAAILCRRKEDPSSKTVHLVNLNGSQKRSTIIENVQINHMAFNPGSTRLALAKQDGEIKVIDITTPERFQSFKDSKSYANFVCFSPSGRLMASSFDNRKILVWSVASSHLVKVLESGRSFAKPLAFLEDEALLLSGHGEAVIRFWNLKTGSFERETSSQNTSDPEQSAIQLLGFNKEEETIYALAHNGAYIRGLKPPLPQVLSHEAGQYPYVYDVEFSPCGRRLASSGWDRYVRIWDVATGRLISALKTPERVFWARYAPDGQRLLVCVNYGGDYNTLFSWNARTLVNEKELAFRNQKPCGLFAPGLDGFLLASGSELWVVDPQTLKIRKKLSQDSVVWSMGLSPDKKLIACGASNGQCQILDSQTLKPLFRIKAHKQGVRSVAFSPDGERLATGAKDAEVRIWDLKTLETLVEIKTQGANELFTLCFTPDSRRLLLGSRLTTIGVWDADSGIELVRFHGHEDYVHDLAMSPDGRILASASGDNTVRLWDTRPLKDRIQERDHLLDAERVMNKRVEDLFKKFGSMDKVMETMQMDASLSPLEKYAAWNAAQRKQQ